MRRRRRSRSARRGGLRSRIPTRAVTRLPELVGAEERERQPVVQHDAELAIGYSTAYDVTRARASLTQRFSLTRRIHCWDAVFTRSFPWAARPIPPFRIGVRDQREIYYERGTRAQSYGGIN